MKKILKNILSVAVVSAMFGCGQNKQPDTGNSTPVKQAKEEQTIPDSLHSLSTKCFSDTIQIKKEYLKDIYNQPAFLWAKNKHPKIIAIHEPPNDENIKTSVYWYFLFNDNGELVMIGNPYLNLQYFLDKNKAIKLDGPSEFTVIDFYGKDSSPDSLQSPVRKTYHIWAMQIDRLLRTSKNALFYKFYAYFPEYIFYLNSDLKIFDQPDASSKSYLIPKGNTIGYSMPVYSKTNPTNNSVWTEILVLNRGGGGLMYAKTNDFYSCAFYAPVSQ